MRNISHKKHRPTLNAQEPSAKLELFNCNKLHPCFFHGFFIWKPVYQINLQIDCKLITWFLYNEVIDSCLFNFDY